MSKFGKNRVIKNSPQNGIVFNGIAALQYAMSNVKRGKNSPIIKIHISTSAILLFVCYDVIESSNRNNPINRLYTIASAKRDPTYRARRRHKSITSTPLPHVNKNTAYDTASVTITIPPKIAKTSVGITISYLKIKAGQIISDLYVTHSHWRCTTCYILTYTQKFLS